MAYTFNCRSFRAVAEGSNPGLLAKVYCTCVWLELAVKGHLGVAASGISHQLPAMLKQAPLCNAALAGQVNSLSVQLETRLRALWCQSKTVSAVRVRPIAYPDVRYLRHASDWPTDCSSDGDLKDLHQLLQRIVYFLQTNSSLAL